MGSDLCCALRRSRLWHWHFWWRCFLLGRVFFRAEFGVETSSAVDRHVFGMLFDPELGFLLLFYTLARLFAGFDFPLGFPTRNATRIPGELSRRGT